MDLYYVAAASVLKCIAGWIAGNDDGENEPELEATPHTQTLNSGEQEEWIKLNVGGQIFATSRTTLCTREPSSMLARMFCSDLSSSLSPSRRDETGAYMIDRSPEYFAPVLNYLRHGKLIVDHNINIGGILEEADFFGIESLIPLLKATPLTRLDVIRAPMFTSAHTTPLRFQGFNLAGADLSKLDLGNINLKGANLRCADLRGANLKNSDLSEANLAHADLSESNIEGTKLSGANLEGCNLAGLDLSKRNLVQVNLKNANLRGANLQGANLTFTHLQHADLSKSNLEGAWLCGSSLARANLQDSNLKAIKIGNRPIGISFESANLKNVIFDGSQLAGVNFRGAILSGARLRNCNLRSAIFVGADISNCSFSGSCLK